VSKNCKWVTLGEVTDFQGGSQPSKNYFSNVNKNGYIRFIQIRDYKTDEYLTYIPKEMARKFCSKDDIMIGRYGPPIFQILRGIEGAYNVALIKAIPKGVNKEFLYYFLKQDCLYEYINSFSERTAGQSGIDMKKLREYPFPLYHEEDQKKIAEILDRASNLISLRKKQIEKLDLLVKAKFIEMFGDPEKNPMGWEETTVGKCLDVLTDYHANGSYETLRDNVSLLDIPDYALMVRTTDLEKNNFVDAVKYIDEHAYNHLEKSKVFGGEIIINKIGSAGKVYLMPYLNRPVSLAMNQFLLRFNENKINHVFIYNLLTTSCCESRILERVRGAVTKTITKDAVREVEIFVPPIDLQNQFADFVQQVEKQKTQLQQGLEKLELTYKALMQQYFN